MRVGPTCNRIDSDEEVNEEELWHHSDRWIRGANRILEAGDVGRLRELLRGESGGQGEDVRTAGRFISGVDCGRLHIILLGLYPVHTACRAGHLGMVRFILRTFLPASVMYNERDSSALHTAARFGRLEIARELLGHDASVLSRDRAGCTPREQHSTSHPGRRTHRPC